MKNNRIVKIMDMVEEAGEDTVKEILSGFSCEYAPGKKNEEVEQFLIRNSTEFSRKKISITYLVMDDDMQVVGYFTLAHKPINIPAAALKSKNVRKKMQRYANYDEALQSYSVSAFLIAQ